MGLFFAYETQLPASVGFHWYGTGHWIWLIAITAACVLAGLLSPRLSHQGQRRLQWGLSLSSAALICCMELFFWLTGNFGPRTLPLHLCSMAPFLTVLHCLFRRDWLDQVVYTLCMPGAAAALLFPGWSDYPLFSFMGMEGFLSHGLILAYGVTALACGRIRPRLTRLWKVWVFLAVVVPPVYWFNQRYNCNYWFINWSIPGSPLEFLAKFGFPGYLIAYGMLALIIMLLLDLPWILYQDKPEQK